MNEHTSAAETMFYSFGGKKSKNNIYPNSGED